MDGNSDLTPLDRAARALEDALRHEVSGLPHETYRDCVKRVLHAIREPSEGMVRIAAHDELVDVDKPYPDFLVSLYTRMIDTAMEEG